MKKKCFWIIVGLVCFLPGAAYARGGAETIHNGEVFDTLVNLIQWSEAEGGNGHWYAIMPELMVWDWADSVAHLFIRDGLQGYLATVTSAEENVFIVDHVIADIVNDTYYDEYCLGGVFRDSTWSWITGEPFEYTNWAPGQPATNFQSGILMMWGNSSEIYGLPGEWEIWYNHHGDFWSIIEWGGLEDRDYDSVPDPWDNCPDIPNFSQTNSDKDSLGDACDNCPFSYNPDQADSNDNGIGDVCDTIVSDVGYGDNYLNIPRNLLLRQNYPNPFNKSTVIEFSLPRASPVKVAIFNTLGQVIKTVYIDHALAGKNTVFWDGLDGRGNTSPSGIYYYQFETNGICETKRMILLK